MRSTKKLKTSLLRGLTICLFAPLLAFPASFRVVSTIALPESGQWGSVTLDANARRLYITDSTGVLVFDMDRGGVAGKIPIASGAAGVAIANDLGRGFVSCGRDNQVAIYDLRTLAIIDMVKAGVEPEGIVYDRLSHRVFVFNKGSKDMTGIDGATGYIAGTIPLGGVPKNPISDDKGNLYVNLEDRSELVRFDPVSLEVLNHWPIASCVNAAGLALDAKGSRAFIACANKMMAVVDTAQGNVITSVQTGEGNGSAAFDPGQKLIFSSNDDGTLTVVKQESADKYSVLESVKTEAGARSIAFDQKTHKIYLPSARFGPAPKSFKANANASPAIIPGTFKLLIVSR